MSERGTRDHVGSGMNFRQVALIDKDSSQYCFLSKILVYNKAN